MEQKNKLKVYKFETTRLKKNEDGTVSDERETLACGYAFEGDPSPRVDYNRYWELGDGCVNLISKDGKPVYPDVISTIDWLCCGEGFRSDDVRKMFDGLESPGKWAEACLHDNTKTTLRVTRLAELPEIDPEATIRNSDLSATQQHRIKIDGVPLFPEGGTVDVYDPTGPKMVLRPNLARELGKVWEEVIHHRSSGANVYVEVSTVNCSANAANAKLTIKASTRKELNSALSAVGVLRPQDIEPNLMEGEGDELTGFTATVVLTTEV